MQADVLEFRKIISTGGERRGVEALGSGMLGKSGDFGCWVTVFANSLFQKGILSLMDLARKIDGVKARSAGWDTA